MVDRYEIWHAALALLAVAWLARECRDQPWCRTARVWLALGSLLPLWDYLLPLAGAPDRIAFLIRELPLHGLVNGAVGIAGGAFVLALVRGVRPAALAGCWVLAGYLFHLLLDWSAGHPVWLGPPDAARGSDWTAFEPGHVPLLIFVALGLAVRELVPKWARVARNIVLGGVVIYALGGAAQYGVVRLQVAQAVLGAGDLAVLPAGPARTRWWVVAADAGGYRVAMVNAAGTLLAGPEQLAMADDLPALLARLHDPTVRHMVLTRFRHPVVTVARTDTGATLVVREAVDLYARREGPTFTFQTAIDDRERVYRVERFH